MSLSIGALALALLAPRASAGITPADWAEPAPDTTYARLVRQYTTDPRFLSPLVADLPDDPHVPSPREFLGYVVGAPGKLTYYSEIKAYFETLAKASPRVTVESIGKSNEGREMIVATIADEDVLGQLPEYRDDTARLADPRKTDEAAARDIIARAKPFYYLTGGLHSTETASPEMLMELAYRLATSNSPLARRIRKNVIVMITPVLETDGRERVTDWYYNVTIDYDDWQNMPQRYPPYWGKYVFHDNNRDGIQLTQPLSRHVMDLYFRYHPQIMHDLHESIPLLYISSGTGPYNDSLDPIVTSEWQWLANNEVTELTKLGLPGVWTWGFYTGWWPGYLLWIANTHNGIGRFYETFGNAGANTFERKLEGKFAGKKITTRQWYRPWPPDKKVEWSFRNSINYMESGVLAALDFAAQNGEDLLYNFWKTGHNSLGRGRTQAPYAWVVPRRNRSRAELSQLVQTLLDQGIEVHRLDDGVEVGGKKFAAGDIVVRMDQPYRDFAKSLMEPQHFPKDAEFTPYDDVAWTLPLLYGVDATRVDDADILKATMTRITRAPRPSAPAPRKRALYVIRPTSSSRFLEARFMLRDATVFAADTSFAIRGTDYPRGSWIVSGTSSGDALFSAVARVADSLGLDVDGVRSVPDDLPRHPIGVPRIAVFHTWTYTQDSGWVRYTFDRDHIPYTLINKDDLRDGDLHAYYDVILMPNTGWSRARDIVHGIDPKFGPIPYHTTESSPNLGRIDESDDITGGMGFEGLREVARFVDDGGTLITFGGAGLLPVEMGLVRHVNRVRPPGFSNPGSEVSVRVAQASSPLVAGYPDSTSVFRGFSPLFTVDEHFAPEYTVMVYGSKLPGEDANGGEDGAGKAKPAGKICLSGGVRGEKQLDGKPAILDIPRGKGRIMIFTFDPMHRYLNLSDFGLANDAILNWNHH